MMQMGIHFELFNVIFDMFQTDASQKDFMMQAIRDS